MRTIKKKKKTCRHGPVLKKFMKIKCLSTAIKVTNYRFQKLGRDFRVQLTVFSALVRYLQAFNIQRTKTEETKANKMKLNIMQAKQNSV